MMLRKLSQTKSSIREQSPLLRFWKARAYRDSRQRSIKQGGHKT